MKNADKPKIDNIPFDSHAEAERYKALKLLQKAGKIKDLTAEKEKLRWPLVVGGVLIGRYTADFSYIEQGRLVVEDVKGGPCSRDVPLRLKLLLALHGIQVRLVNSDGTPWKAPTKKSSATLRPRVKRPVKG